MRGLCYISGKISGLDYTTAEAMFKQAETDLIKYGYRVINPMSLPHEHGRSWAEFMREDLKALLNCTHIFMLSNWQDSKGAIIEHELAEDLGINIFYEIVG